jgi:cation diffusion facilitator family transporter
VTLVSSWWRPGWLASHELTAGERHQARRLFLVLLIIAGFCAAEAAGAAWADSDVLRAEALHLLADVGVLGLACAGIRLSVERPSARFTFGLRRAEPLLAMINALLVLGATALLVVEAIADWSRPSGPRADRMLYVAAAGVVVNGIAASLIHGAMAGPPSSRPLAPPSEEGAAPCSDHSHLHLAHTAQHGGHGHSLNLRGAWLHLIGDALGSLSALVAALIIRLGGSPRFDAAATFVVAAILVYGASRLLWDAALVLLEATPNSIPLDRVRETILETSGVLEVRALHVWTLGAGHEAIMAHIKAAMPDAGLSARVEDRLRQAFRVEYITIQIDN